MNMSYYDELIHLLKTFVASSESMEESIYNNHQKIEEMNEALDSMIKIGIDGSAFRNLKDHLDQIDHKMYELTKLIESEKNVSDDLKRVIESYHPCVYGPPV